MGRAIDGRQILILDQDQQLCPIGVRGEIYVRSRYLTMGYFGRPEETRERFIQNPLHNDHHDTVYRTGDIGCWSPDGTIEFHGRTDNQVKLHGIRVELADIEGVLRRYPGIGDSHVAVRTVQRGRDKLIAKERTTRGSDNNSVGQQILVAYFTSEKQLAGVDIRRFIQDHLPAHMIPHQFLQLDELPLNANRKLDLNALPEPSNLRPELAESYTAPRDRIEELLVGIWQDVLGIDPIGVDDGFFDLGGDSLSAMQVLNRMSRVANGKLSFRDLFERQTISRLAEVTRQSDKEAVVPTTATKAFPPRRTYPLSLAQRGIWFLWKFDPTNPYYTAQASIHVRGIVNVPVLKRAWRALVQRHVILQARFGMEDDQPVQMFDREREVDLPYIELQRLPYAERQPAMEAAVRKKAQYALDLEQDVLLQAQLFKLSETEGEIALTFHEIIIDLWALSIMIHDLGLLYQGYLDGEESPLPALSVHFSDFVLGEGEHVRRDNLAVQREYWDQELSGELPILNLPTDRPRPVSPSYRGDTRSLFLDADLSQRLKELGAQHDATLFMTLLAAFNVLLRGYAQQDDIIIGAPIANRTDANTEDIVGFFLNMLPLRTRLGDDPSFITLLERTRVTVTEGITNAAYPFIWMLETANITRDLSVSPVFQVMFNMLNLPQVSQKLGDVEFACSELDTGYTKYDLSLYAQEHGDQIFLQLAYITDLFDDATIERMMKNLVALLKSIVDDPESAISRLRMLDEAERQTLVYGFNDTDLDFGNDLCIHQLFERQAKNTPDQIAFTFRDVHVTYADLNARANQLAHFLRRAGVGPETIVAICTNRSIEMMVGLLGIMKAGGVYVALDPEYPLLRLYDILEDSKPSILILQKEVDRFDTFGGKKIYLDGEWKVIAKEQSTNPVCLTTPEHLLNIVYTSSTTGRPKGTLITIDSVLNRLHWMWQAYPFRPHDVAVLQKSYALVAATWECFGALLKGVPTLILSQEDLLDPTQLWDKVVTHRVTYFLASPAVLEGVLYQAEAHPEQWKSLRLATTSAEPIKPSMVARWKQCFPEVPLLNLYGATECASNATAYDTSQLPPEASRVPVGKPLANTKVYVLDQHANPVPIGVVGEMCITGSCLARGYLNLPELSSSRFVSDPFADELGAQMLKTGDLARVLSSGNIELIGRQDYQVKVRGFRVELGDIEEALARHDAVERCVVTLFEIDPARSHLVAYVVSAVSLAPQTLREFLRERLPEYMVPSDFVFPDALPLTPSGKVDRRALAPPPLTRPELDGSFVPPRNPVEEIVASIWTDALGIDQVGVHDNFYDLGGHSLLSIRVANQIEKKLGVRVNPGQLIMQTLGQLAAQCGPASNSGGMKRRGLAALFDQVKRTIARR